MIEMTMAENNSTDLINPNPQQFCIMNYAIFTHSSIKKEGISFLTAKNTYQCRDSMFCNWSWFNVLERHVIMLYFLIHLLFYARGFKWATKIAMQCVYLIHDLCYLNGKYQ